MSLFGPPKVAKLAEKRDVTGLIKALGYRQDSAIRAPAAQALGRLGDLRAVEALIGALRDEDWKVRDAAVGALGRLGDLRAVEALIEALHDGHPADRGKVTEALATSSASTEPLLGALGDADESVRVRAACALAERGDPRALSTLLSALDHRPDMNTAVAVDGLRDLRSADAVMPLVRVLGELKISDLYSADDWLGVVDALRAIGDPRAVDALLHPASIQNTAFGLLQHSGQLGNRDFEASVVEALAECGREAVPTLVSSLVQEESRLAALALTRLGWSPDSEEERLSFALARGEWVEAGEVGASALEPLLRALDFEFVDGQWTHSGGFGNGDVEHQDTNKLVAIADALGATGDARAVGPLVQILSGDLNVWPSGVVPVRRAAGYALGGLGAPAVAPLADLIGSREYRAGDCEEEAARALARCGPEGLEVLGQSLPRHSEAHRRHRELDRSEPGTSHYDDVDITGYRKWEAIREALVQAGQGAMPLLRAMQNDGNEGVRLDAAELIAEIAQQEPDQL